MKKALSIMLTLVMIVSMLSMMTITGSAATSYKAVKASSAPKLDGEKDSVYGSSKIELVNQKTGEKSGSYAHICWYGKDLYVFFHVVDDTEPVYKQFGADDYVYKSYMTDCVEIAIGFDGKTSENVNSNNKYGYNAQIRFNPYYTSTTHKDAHEGENGGYLGIPFSSTNMSKTLDVKGGKSKAYYKKTSEGYNVEIKLNTGGKLSETPCFGLVVCDADVASENAGNNSGGHRDPYVLNKLDDYFSLGAQYDLTLEGYSVASEKKDELNAIESSKAAVSASRAALSASRAASLAALSASKAALSSKSSSKTSSATASGTTASDATSSDATSTETSDVTSTESTASTNEEIGGTTVDDNTDGGDADNTIGADSGEVEEGGSGLLWIIIGAGAGLLVLAAAAVVLFVVLKKKNGAVTEEVVADDAQQEELDFGDEE